ncbi:MAG: RNA polymerase recycling motor HelD [Bacillota bacterium]|nr:RNA polymerase recycling motor HelD [Bacillota bacterium]
MPIKEHPDYPMEKERLDYTIDYLGKTLGATEKFIRVYKGNVANAREGFDPEDASAIFVNMLLNSKLMDKAQKNYYNYKKAKAKPYFARIDFKKEGEGSVNRLYIGKTSLIRPEDNELIIVDWRAPVAALYYEGRLGETAYEAQDGEELGELSLKRQFTIKDGELEGIFDIDITTNDELLQASLEAGAESRLKDIAATIQAEQNRIIRAPMFKPLMVQGVAGSGKTTIALHRIAYFVYTYEATFDPENFLIIAPNNLFINYISEVLPELGVENVQQSTFVDFMNSLLGKTLKLTDSNEKLMYIIHHPGEEETGLIKWASAFKGSMEFKEIVEDYMRDIELNFVPEVDFSIGGRVLMTYGEMRRMFLEDLIYHPFHKRIDEIKKSLKNKLKLVNKKMLSSVEDLYYTKMEKVRRTVTDTEEKRVLITELAERRDRDMKKLTAELKESVKEYGEKYPQDTLEEYYKKLISSPDMLRKYSKGPLPEKELIYLCETSRRRMEDKKFELEDYAAMVYMKQKIFGFSKKVGINSAVVDEAQDFSLFQFFTLKKVLNSGMITLLGDLSQGIHSYRAIDNWQEVQEKIFGIRDSSYMTLEQSYRTTIEVMELANEVIKKLNKEDMIIAKPVIRHGEKPEIRDFKRSADLISALENSLSEMKGKGYKSTAVVCKTEKECEKIKKVLDKRGVADSKILTEKLHQYEAGVIIVPSHLAKGLEFDVVFIVNLEESYGYNELDIKLLYVAMTRTMHRLFVYHMDGKMPLLEEAGIDKGSS